MTATKDRITGKVSSATPDSGQVKRAAGTAQQPDGGSRAGLWQKLLKKGSVV